MIKLIEYMKDVLGLFILIKRCVYFADLLAKDGSITIQTRHLQVLATGMLKVHKNMWTELMQGFSCVRQAAHYNLSNPHQYPNHKFCLPWLESISNLGPRI